MGMYTAVRKSKKGLTNRLVSVSNPVKPCRHSVKPCRITVSPSSLLSLFRDYCAIHVLLTTKSPLSLFVQLLFLKCARLLLVNARSLPSSLSLSLLCPTDAPSHSLFPLFSFSPSLFFLSVAQHLVLSPTPKPFRTQSS